MQKLTFNSISKILDKRTRRKLFGLAIARVAANLLDLVGLAGIALLATSFGSLASGSSSIAPLNLPILGAVLITEIQAVLIAGLVAVVFLLKSGFSIWLNLLTSLTVANLEANFSRQLANDFFGSRLDDEKGAMETVADFQNRVLYSTTAISSFLNARLTLIAEGSLLVALLSIFLIVNPIATVSMFAFMGSVLLVLNRFISHRIVRNGKLQMSGYETALETSRDLFGIRREALASGTTQLWLDKFARGRAQAARGYALTYTLNTLPRYVVETSLVLGILAFIGGVVIFSDLSSQAVTVGVFMAGGLRLIASLLPLQAAFNQMQDGANRGAPAFNSILQTKTESEVSATKKSENLPGDLGIVFDRVSFAYAGSSEQVLHEVSFEVAPLSKVAIVGPSGAGKSTLFDLATGFRDPLSGSISIGRHSPREALGSIPGVFGIVTQRPQLVSGTISENISLTSQSETDLEKVKQCLLRSGLESFTRSANWAEFRIRPDQGQLSGGEIQRLGLARALYRSPRILFLDEATSALDAETEDKISKVIQGLSAELTVVLIAHRLSTVMNADKLIYLDRGKLVAEGSFNELKAKVPGFAKAVSLMSID